jgi:hypothetical protein
VTPFSPLLLRVTLAILGAVAPATGWTQFGGPHRNFTVEGPTLAATWPAAGPKEVWRRELGEGFADRGRG